MTLPATQTLSDGTPSLKFEIEFDWADVLGDDGWNLDNEEPIDNVLILTLTLAGSSAPRNSMGVPVVGAGETSAQGIYLLILDLSTFEYMPPP